MKCARRIEHDVVLSEDADRRFHEVIAAATQNSGMIAAVKMLWDARTRSPQSRSLSSKVRATRRRSPRIDEHTAILKALRQRDPDAAREAMRDHLITRHRCPAQGHRGPGTGARPSANRRAAQALRREQIAVSFRRRKRRPINRELARGLGNLSVDIAGLVRPEWHDQYPSRIQRPDLMHTIVDARVIITCPGRNFVTLKITTKSGVYWLG